MFIPGALSNTTGGATPEIIRRKPAVIGAEPGGPTHSSSRHFQLGFMTHRRAIKVEDGTYLSQKQCDGSHRALRILIFILCYSEDSCSRCGWFTDASSRQCSFFSF